MLVLELLGGAIWHWTHEIKMDKVFDEENNFQ